jgi:hypothetical protein
MVGMANGKRVDWIFVASGVPWYFPLLGIDVIDSHPQYLFDLQTWV